VLKSIVEKESKRGREGEKVLTLAPLNGRVYFRKADLMNRWLL
jgi:hypothetical protein